MFGCASHLYHRISMGSFFLGRGLVKKGAYFVGGGGLGCFVKQCHDNVFGGASSHIAYAAVEQRDSLREKVTPLSSPSFPNIFCAETEKEKKEMIQKLETIFCHIVRNLKIPFVNPQTKHVHLLGLFETIDQIVQKHDPESRVYLAGGSIRSVFSYICKEIYKAHEQTGISCEELLDRLSRGAFKVGDEDADGAILGISVLGVESDIDIYIQCANPQLQMEIVEEVKTLIDQSAHRFKHPLKSAVFPSADVQDYETQLQRSSSCGGSPLDWLAFPLTERSGNSFVVPRARPNVLNELCDGKIGYASTENAESQEITTLRMYRSLCELPFLTLLEEDEERFIADLNKVKQFLPSSLFEYQRVSTVFQKILQNTRFPDRYNMEVTPCVISEVCPERRRIIADISSGGLGFRKLPELVPTRSSQEELDFEMISFLEKNKLFMEEEFFIQNYTDSGMLYHGTKSLSNIIPMTRGNLVLSSSSQGCAAYGRGFYTTSQFSEANSYAKGKEFVLKIPVKKGSLKVISWVDLPIDVIKMIEEKAEAKKIDRFQYLEKYLGVNVIINRYVLIQNISALDLQERHEEILKQVLSDSILRKTERVRNLNQSLEWYSSSSVYSYSIKRGLVEEVRNLSKKTLFLQNLLSRKEFEEINTVVNDSIGVCKKILRDGEFCLQALDEGFIDENDVDPSLWQDRSFMLSLLARSSRYFARLDPSLKKEPSFMLQAVKQNAEVLRDVDSELSSDRVFMLEAVIQDAKIWPQLSSSLHCSRDFVLKALSLNYELFPFLDLSWRSDPEFVSLALSQDPNHFQFVGEALRDDSDMVLLLLSQQGSLLKWASNRIQRDPQSVQIAIENSIEAIQWADPSLLNDYDFMLKNCSKSLKLLSYVGEELKSHQGFICEMQKRGAFQYGDSTWKRHAARNIQSPMKNPDLNLPVKKGFSLLFS